MDSETRFSDIKKLDQAWSGIETAINAIGTKIRALKANENPLHRYEAYKTALATFAESYASQMHFDRQRPESLLTVGQLFNYAATNPDFSYRLIHIEPGGCYRVWGWRGDSQMIDVQQNVGWFGHAREAGKPPSTTMANEVFEAKNIMPDAQGNFDFILSPDPGDASGGQWWKLEAGVNTLLLREYFTDYATQGRASVFHIDKLGGKDQGSTVPDIGQAVARLDGMARIMQELTPLIAIPDPPTGAEMNQFKEMNFSAAAGAVDQCYFQARFDVKPGEALIGKWVVPADYAYWGITLYNTSYQMLNCSNRQVNLNHGLAGVGADKVFYFVISHQDPGIANWLDVDGHEQGLVMLRTKGCLGPALPSLQLVPIGDVLKHLPKDIARVSTGERTNNLALRRRHYQLRENC